MKQHLAAIAFNERELEAYVTQLKTQRFETISEAKKAEDGTWYQVLAKTVKAEAIIPPKPVEAIVDEVIPA